MSRLQKAVAAFTATLSMVIVTVISSVGIASASTPITGKITCSPSLPVVGIWVEDLTNVSGSGWATLTGGSGNISDYIKYNVDSSHNYKLNVGCGGSPSSWQVTAESGTLTGSSNELVCFTVYTWRNPWWYGCF